MQKCPDFQMDIKILMELLQMKTMFCLLAGGESIDS